MMKIAAFVGGVVLSVGLVGCTCGPCPDGACVADAGGGSAGGFGGFGGGGGGNAGGTSSGGSAAGGSAGGASAGGSAAGGNAGGLSAGGSAGGLTAGGNAGGGQSASCAPGSLKLFPATLDFGEQATNCPRQLPVVLYNTCAFPQSATLSPTGAVFSADAGFLVVPAGGVLEVPVTFRPPQLGLRMDTLAGSSTSGALAVPLRGLGVLAADTTDTFLQPARPKADVVVVLSEGPAMSPIQQALAADATRVLLYATASQVDFGLRVVPDGGSLSPVTPNLEQVWRQRFSVGETGSPTVSCLGRAFELLSTNPGWLRPNSTLGLVCAQNTYEQLVGPPATWVRLLQMAASRSRNELTISAVANFAPCAGVEDDALSVATDVTRGSKVSACALDAGVFESIGKSAFGYRTTWFLSRAASEDGGVDVAIDGLSVPQRDPRGAGIWAFDPVLDAVVFEPLYVPEPGKTLTIRYRAACGP